MQAARKATQLRGVATLATLATLGLAPVHAQVQLTGHHDGSATSNGYYASNGLYAVPVDSGTTPSATFNNNKYDGLNTYNTILTVGGGQFNGNGSAGLYVFTGSASVTGGQFNSNGSYGLTFTNTSTGTVSGDISGGTFTGNYVAIDAENNAMVTISGGSLTGNTLAAITSYTGSDVVVRGGQFSGNGYDFYAGGDINSGFPGGVIDIYGSFTVPGSATPLTPGQTYNLKGFGFFSGTLANNTVSQTYAYNNTAATITLHDVAAAPEPSQTATLGLGVLGLCVLALKARKRKPVA